MSFLQRSGLENAAAADAAYEQEYRYNMSMECGERNERDKHKHRNNNAIGLHGAGRESGLLSGRAAALPPERYPVLSEPIVWGPVSNCFVLTDEPADESLVSNVSVIPFVGGQCVMMQLEDGRWELPGGTLEEGEHYARALEREMMEELGAELASYRIFGRYECFSAADKPYRPYIPHPHFIRLIGLGEVRLTGKPLNPPDGEQVAHVEAMAVDRAAALFRAQGRSDLAELYELADEIRRAEARP